MNAVAAILLSFLVLCAISACATRNLLISIVIFMGYSLVMSVVWLLLESPDLAITEAAVGAGITSILFFVTLKRIQQIDRRSRSRTGSAADRRTGSPADRREGDWGRRESDRREGDRREGDRREGDRREDDRRAWGRRESDRNEGAERRQGEST